MKYTWLSCRAAKSSASPAKRRCHASVGSKPPGNTARLRVSQYRCERYLVTLVTAQ